MSESPLTVGTETHHERRSASTRGNHWSCRVSDANKAISEVENSGFAVEQAAQTGLGSVLGEVELDDLLSQREKVNNRLQTILDEHAEEWGVKVIHVQVKQVALPQEMQR